MPTEPTSLASIIPLAEKLAPKLLEPAKGMAKHLKERMEVKFRLGFSKFIEKNKERFSTVKTILSSSTPIPLLSIYVNLHLALARKGSDALRDDDFINQISKYKCVMFTATAGAGKSMLMRYLYIRFLEMQTDRLPIFVELRDL